jgi:ribosomal protein S18 acetylase RimI-like enzyme
MTARPTIQHAARFDVAYRDITNDDMPFLERLYRSTRETELDQVPWSEAEKQAFIDMQFRAQHTYYQANYPDALWLIIAQEGRPVGRLYFDDWTDEFRIIDIALMPEARGQGIGGAILSDILDQAVMAGKNVGIHVEKTNPAMSLYRRLGFTVVEDGGVYDLLVWTPKSQAKTASY